MANPIDATPGADAARAIVAVDKSPGAFRTISEAAEDLGLPQHVLRFWETRFPQIKPLKRAGGRRYYRPDDVELLRAVKQLLYGEGYTIRGVQRLFKEQGARAVVAGSLDSHADRDPAAPDPAPAHREPPNLAAPPAAAPARDPVATPASVGAALTAADIQTLRVALAEIAEGERILSLARPG
ncbi:MAG: MerR family transcriptional regulator [Roseiarcus sp.]|jgi:DNA-binding transcriptional MerR regulator